MFRNKKLIYFTFLGIGTGVLGGNVIYYRDRLQKREEQLSLALGEIANVKRELIIKQDTSDQHLKESRDKHSQLEKTIDTLVDLNYPGATLESLFGNIDRKHGAPIPLTEEHAHLIKYGVPSTANLWFYESYVSSPNYERKIPNWVLQRISLSDFDNKVADRKNSYFNNKTPQIPDTFRAENKDYFGSGWSRGHMIPAGDNVKSQEAMNQTFLLNTNIVPQDLQNNVNFWYRFEVFCKKTLPTRYKHVYVVSGPVFQHNHIEPLSQEEMDKRWKFSKKTERRYVKHEVIGDNHVAVPTHLFKVILAEPLDDTEPVAIGSFIIPNQPIGSEAQLLDYEVPLQELQKKTGLQFFRKLDFSKVTPLSQNASNCTLMSEKELEVHNIPRRIGWAKNKKELNDLITDIQQKSLPLSEKDQSAINDKMQLFEQSLVPPPTPKQLENAISS
ncbi:hypothetical protein CYY_007645 [Polysphondylium violaceum]|uniref:Uncharacterized protein n=1 Tax=Polysphondylium violaceum TaxID=133409 RepID=A0A8J4V4R2_9MYCE|nr:hypothetical protein CYY_007645 [Polysphondylium violaceum]